MKKEKLTSIMIVALLTLSSLALAYSPIVSSGNFVEENDQNFYGTVEPQTVAGAYPYPEYQFQFNITCNATGANITKIEFTLPKDWVYKSATNNSAWNVTASGTSSVTYENRTDEAALAEGEWALFNITAQVVPGIGTWNITCYNGTKSLGSAYVNVTVTPWFDASITPDLVKKGETLWFEIPVTNNASSSSIYEVNVTYPSSDDWTFQDMSAPEGWFIQSHHPPYVIFRATGGFEIEAGESATFKFRMITGGKEDSTDTYEWQVLCKNTAGVNASLTLTVTSDNMRPQITIDAPAPTVSHYSVGAGNYVWINVTVWDDLDKQPTVELNATGFVLHSSTKSAADGGYDFKFFYRNNTVIPDGPFAIQVNATDYVGNEATPAERFTTIDNTPPFIWVNIGPDATQVGSTFWIGKETTSIWVNVTVADYGIDKLFTGIYVNGTLQAWDFSETGKNYTGYPIWESNNTLSLDLDAKYWVIHVNVTDSSRPSNHTSEMTVYIQRDYVPPYEIGFTSVTPICGGLIVYGLYAEDLVGVNDYVFKNGSVELAIIQQTTLDANSWQSDTCWGAFGGVAVLNLTDYAGEFVNITVCARDFGLNEGDEIIVYTGTIPEGEWYPVELHEGWNLISLPLIPNSTDSSEILSLRLKQGGAEEVFGWDGGWQRNPATMEDGKGYWVKMQEYDVLIVQGYNVAEPPGSPPPVICYSLSAGWNLAGFTSTTSMSVDDYLGSLEENSYYTRLYTWDAANQRWITVSGDQSLTPGQGFWIFMYEEQTLIPPA